MTTTSERFCPNCNARLGLDEPGACASCGRSRPPVGWPSDALLGQLVAGGQLRVQRRLGAGGFGVVYEVETVLGGLVRAMKVLSAHWLSSTDILERFVNEAVILDRLDHRHVARCHAIGRLENAGEPYMLLERVRGEKLSSLVRAAGSFAPERAMRVARQIATALGAAHGLNLLHRDLSPDNVLVTDPGAPSESVKIIDFGVAKILGEGSLGRTAAVVGTHEFMAPEQYTPGADLDPRLDLWQLGALLHFMLTGQPPYRSEGRTTGPLGIFRLQEARRGRPGPAPSEVRPELTSFPLLDALVSDLLATEPAHRPATAADVLERLDGADPTVADVTTFRRVTGLDTLAAKSSPEHWTAIIAHLERTPAGPQREREIALAERLLEAWPDRLRVAPLPWWRALTRGEPVPQWRLVRRLDLSFGGVDDETMEAIARLPALGTLSILELSDNAIGNVGLRALAASPYVTRLKELSLARNEIGAAGTELLAASTYLVALERLDLSDNAIGMRGAAALAQATALERLRSLDVSANDIRDAGFASLVASPVLQRLERLIAGSNRIGGVAGSNLAASQLLGRLRELDLRHNRLGPAGAAALAAARDAGRLERLVLAENGLGREGTAAVVSSPNLLSLRHLDLSDNAVGSAGAVALAHAPGLSRLQSFELAGCELGDAGLAVLALSPYLGGLSSLGLARNAIGPHGIAVLAAAPRQSALARLDLAANPVGPEGVQILAQAPSLRGLGELDLTSCGIGPAGFASIIGSAVLDGLAHLAVGNNGIGAEGLSAAASLPGLERLRTLRLADNGVGRNGAYVLVQSPYVAALAELDLAKNGLGDEGLVAIAESQALVGLRTLVVSRNGIGVAGMTALAAARTLRPTRLDLSSNPFGTAGARALARGSSLANVSWLSASSAGIDADGLEALVDAPSLRSAGHLDLTFNAAQRAALLDLRRLQERRISMVTHSFAGLAARAEELTDQFYRELFARHPAVRPLFARTNMVRLRTHLTNALSLVMSNLRTPELLEDTLVKLGARHIAYGAVPAYYRAVVTTLIDVLREMSGTAWNEELEAAWHDALMAVAGTMLKAEEPILRATG